MIEIQHASHWYGQVIGINDVSCTIEAGVTALLGMNGAGKTTMIRMITGQLRSHTGSVRVFGEDPFSNPSVYRHLGYCPDIDNFYEHMSGRQFVTMMARMSEIGPAEAAEQASAMLEQVGMTAWADRKIAGYSKGMRQRIKLAQAMIHDPDIILLDEPLNGLDPVGRRALMDLLGSLAAAGKVIIVSSHILFEVEQMTRNILLLNRGRLLATGDLRVIRELIDTHPHRIHIQTDRPREVAEKLIELPSIISMQFDPDGRGLELHTKEPHKFYAFMPKVVLEHNLPVTSITSPDNNLEAVFRYLVGG